MGHLTFRQNKVCYTAALVVLWVTGYFFTNHFHFFPGTTLPFTWVDRAIPYLSWTVIIYLSYYALVVLPLLWCDQKKIFRDMFLAYLGLVIISEAIFFFFPTRIFRDFSPYRDYFTVHFCSLIARVDSEFNACPSLHVSLSLVGALTYLRYRRYGTGMAFLIWGILVSLSTMTVKQHCFIDVVSAFLLTVGFVAGVARARTLPSRPRPAEEKATEVGRVNLSMVSFNKVVAHQD